MNAEPHQLGRTNHPYADKTVNDEDLSPPSRTIRSNRARGSYHAIAATKDDLSFPPFEPLGYLTQSRLIQQAQAGDVDAMQTVWLRHARLAFSVANQAGIPPELLSDAIQEGQIGLERAIRQFDVERLLELSTYAFVAIRRHMQRFIPRCRGFVPIPVYLYADYRRYCREVTEAPTRQSWFDARERYMDASQSRYCALAQLHVAARPVPISRKTQYIIDRPSPITDLLRHEFQMLVREFINKLPQRQAAVIRLRYGMVNQTEHTLESVGQHLGLTKERVRQLQVSAEKAIRVMLADVGWEAEDLTEIPI